MRCVHLSYRVSVWEDGKLLVIDSGDGWTILNVAAQCHGVSHLKWL